MAKATGHIDVTAASGKEWVMISDFDSDNLGFEWLTGSSPSCDKTNNTPNKRYRRVHDRPPHPVLRGKRTPT